MARSPSKVPAGPPLLLQLGRSALAGDWGRILEYPGFLVQLAFQRRINREFQGILGLLQAPPAPVAAGPLISIVIPTFETDAQMLQAAVESVRTQAYPSWELIIADDGSSSAALHAVLDALPATEPRIKVIRGQHQGIVGATNLALGSVMGDWVAFIDHDDVLAPGALAKVAQALAAEPAADLLYTDECRLGPRGNLIEPAFKPCWSPETILGINYVCHWLVVRRALVEELGGLRPGTDGSQDHDFLLRLAARARTAIHLREPLYHWRITRGSAGGLDQTHANGLAAVGAALASGGAGAHAESGPFPCTYRVVSDAAPAFSLVIAQPEDRPLSHHVLATFEAGHATFGAAEIILVGSKAALTSARHLGWTLQEAPSHSLLDCLSVGIEHATRDRAVLLARGSIPMSPRALVPLCATLADPRVGLVTPKLLSGPRRIAAAGLAIDPVRGLVPRFGGHSRRTRLGAGAAQLVQNVSVATFDCAATTKAAWTSVGRANRALAAPLDEVDWCLRAISKGLRIVYHPEAEVEAPSFPAHALGNPSGVAGLRDSYRLPPHDPYFGRGCRMRHAFGREWAVLSSPAWNEASPRVVWRVGVPTA